MFVSRDGKGHYNIFNQTSDKIYVLTDECGEFGDVVVWDMSKYY